MLYSGSEDSPVEKAGVDLCNAGTAVTSTKINGSRMPRATRLMSQLCAGSHYPKGESGRIAIEKNKICVCV